MRKVVLMMSVSLDGFIEGPNREIDWHMVDDELHSHFNEELAKMGASTGPMVELARIWRDKP
jgi:dihydrofolate reductase